MQHKSKPVFGFVLRADGPCARNVILKHGEHVSGADVVSTDHVIFAATVAEVMIVDVIDIKIVLMEKKTHFMFKAQNQFI
jgi:hypothetical protein